MMMSHEVKLYFSDMEDAAAFREEMKRKFNYPERYKYYEVVHGITDTGHNVYITEAKSKYNGKNVTGFEGGISCSAEDKHMKIKDVTIENGEWEEGDDWTATWKGTMKVTYDGMEPLYFDVNVKGTLDEDEYWDEDEDGPKGKKKKVAVLDHGSLNCDDGWEFRDENGNDVTDEMYDTIYPTLDDLEKKVVEAIRDTDFKSSYVKEDDEWVMNARYISEDDEGNVLGEADTYEEAKTLGGTKIVDTMKDDSINSAWGTKISVEEMMDELYDDGCDWDALERVFFDYHHLTDESEVFVDEYYKFKNEAQKEEAFMASSRRLFSKKVNPLQEYVNDVGDELKAYRNIIDLLDDSTIDACLKELQEEVDSSKGLKIRRKRNAK